MEYSKLGLEHFTPDYVDYFHDLPLGERAALLSAQGRLYKAVSADTLAAIRDELDTRSFRRGISDTGVTLMPGVEAVGASRADNALKVVLALRHRSTGEAMTVRTERLVLATGYAPREPRCLAPLDALIERDAEGRFIIERDHRVRTTGTRVGLYVQNAELHTHGVGTPDLGLGAYRAAEILNAVTGRPVYPLPSRTAHIAFAPTVAAAADPGIALDLEDPGHEQHRSQYQPAESGGPGAAVPLLRHRAQHAAQPRRVDAIPAR
jgi:lysine N6-hydroxylase